MVGQGLHVFLLSVPLFASHMHYIKSNGVNEVLACPLTLNADAIALL